jgi:oligoribonuclease NrnB/cAMP/cGMP phosphodiesterase (DHH superfamily)
MDLIITHAGCPDGWCAAYICKMRYPEAEILSLNHGLSDETLEKLINDKCRLKDVIMVDYSLRTREWNDCLNFFAKSFRILDHHKTAQAVLEGAPYATFDMKRSGAGLAWDYLFGVNRNDWEPDEWQGGLARPFWVDYTEDQDLWNWKLPNSQEINAWLMVQPRTVETWDVIAAGMTADDAVRFGKGVREYIEYYTRSVIAEAQEGVFEGHRTAILNIPYVGVSEAGNALCKAGYKVALLWFERGDGVTQFSLRGDGSVDVSAIAKKYGGGGHNNAAGFQVDLVEGRCLVDRALGRNGFVTLVALEEYVIPRCS